MRIKNLPSIESMNGSQDALVIEQTDGSEDKSRKVSPAQIKQYVLGNSIDDIYSVMGQMGAKNLISYPYYDPSGRTNRGITFTYDKDGIITANGSTNANDQAYMTLDDFSRGLVLHSNKKYTLTCEKTNDNNKGFAVLYFKNADNTAKTVSTHVVYEDGTTQNVNRDYVSLLYNNVAHTSATFWVDTDTIYITQARIHTNSGTITNAVLKPMLRLAEDTDNTYQPYAKTNKELTEVIGDLSQTSVTGATVAAQLGVLGNILLFTHFVQIPFTTSVLDSIKDAFENDTIPVDLLGITLGIVSGQTGAQRVIFIAQNQKLSTTQTRYAAIYFGAYTAPRFLQKQDGTNWTDVAL